MAPSLAAARRCLHVWLSASRSSGDRKESTRSSSGSDSAATPPGAGSPPSSGPAGSAAAVHCRLAGGCCSCCGDVLSSTCEGQGNSNTTARQGRHQAGTSSGGKGGGGAHGLHMCLCSALLPSPLRFRTPLRARPRGPWRSPQGRSPRSLRRPCFLPPHGGSIRWSSAARVRGPLPGPAGRLGTPMHRLMQWRHRPPAHVYWALQAITALRQQAGAGTRLSNGFAQPSSPQPAP